MYTAGAKKGHTMNVCDLEFQGQPSRSRNFFNIFDILDLENVRIDTKIDFVSCLQPEIRKVTQKCVWPWFSRSCDKDRIFSLSPLDSLTPKTYPWEIFSKNSDGKAKIQGGGCINPPLGVRRWIFTLGIWDQIHNIYMCVCVLHQVKASAINKFQHKNPFQMW